MKFLARCTIFAMVGGLSGLTGQALMLAAETPPPIPSAPLAPAPQAVPGVPSEPTSPQPITPSRTIPSSPAVSQTPPVTCPPGQFPSAFPDVLPTDWAYEAVNRLASVPIRCFPLPTSLVR